MKPKKLVLVVGISLSLTALGEEERKLSAEDYWAQFEKFPTSVEKQLSEKGVLSAYESADSVAVQLISTPSGQKMIEGGEIVERIIQPESQFIVLTEEQKRLLGLALADSTSYLESRVYCLCIFQPQLRVVFDVGNPKQHYDIFLSGFSHGEIRVVEAKKEIAYARTWRFIPAYLEFLDQVFPDSAITSMLHEFHQYRMTELANQAVEVTPDGAPHL